MSLITQEIAAQIVELTAEGKTPGKIAQELKIKKALIVDHIATQATAIASALELEAGKLAEATVLVTAETVIPTEKDGKASKLANMLASAQAKPNAEEKPAPTGLTRGGNVRVQASSSKNADGTNKQRRNTNVGDRAVAVVTCESLKTCFIGTHLGFATKTPAGAMNVFRTAPQQALKTMQKAEDLVLVLEYTGIALGDHLEELKATAFAKYEALGYQMLCRKPKAAPLAVEPATTETVATTEEATA